MEARRLVEQIGSKTALKIANKFILERMRDRFSAGPPKRVIFPTRCVWIVPVVLTYPKVGMVGDVGEIAVDAETGGIVGWTPVEEMESIAKSIYKDKKSEIEIAFS